MRYDSQDFSGSLGQWWVPTLRIGPQSWKENSKKPFGMASRGVVALLHYRIYLELHVLT